MIDIIILAAGKGTRMVSDLPKAMHKIGGEQMLYHVLNTAEKIKPNSITLVYSSEQLKLACADMPHVHMVEQKQQLGTAHAVKCALKQKDYNKNGRTLVLYGDVPLVRHETLSQMCQHPKDSLVILTLIASNPTGYGRILRASHDAIMAVIEEKDASAGQRNIKEISTGTMLAPTERLIEWVDNLDNDNAQSEYYLTSTIAEAFKDEVEIYSLQPEFEWEVRGVNSMSQLAALERDLHLVRAQELMDSGTSIADPLRTDIRGTLNSSKNVFIDVNNVFEGKVNLGKGVTIEPNCVIKNSTIGAGCVIRAGSIIEDSSVADSEIVGPLAYLHGNKLLR